MEKSSEFLDVFLLETRDWCSHDLYTAHLVPVVGEGISSGCSFCPGPSSLPVVTLPGSCSSQTTRPRALKTLDLCRLQVIFV